MGQVFRGIDFFAKLVSLDLILKRPFCTWFFALLRGKNRKKKKYEFKKYFCIIFYGSVAVKCKKDLKFEM